MFVEHLGTDSALFRKRHPKTWAWDLNIDFLSAILHTLQSANWQRSGGKGTKPKRIKRPDDMGPSIDPNVPMAERKKGHDDEIKRRREAAAARKKRKSKLIERRVADG